MWKWVTVKNFIKFGWNECHGMLIPYGIAHKQFWWWWSSMNVARSLNRRKFSKDRKWNSANSDKMFVKYLSFFPLFFHSWDQIMVKVKRKRPVKVGNQMIEIESCLSYLILFFWSGVSILVKGLQKPAKFVKCLLKHTW